MTPEDGPGHNPPLPPRQLSGARESLRYALPCAVVWGTYLLAYWPGVMSYDSIQQWEQMTTGQLNNWHPAFHTMTNWLLTRPWLSPAAVALAQIATLALLVGWTVARISRLGTPSVAAWVVTLLAAFSPLNAIMAVTLWKDVPYSITVLVLTLFVLEIVTSDGKWLDRRRHWIGLGIVAALAALYRHNGPAAALGTLVVLAVVYRQHRWPMVGAASVALILWLGVRGPLYSALDVGSSTWAPYQPLIHQVAAHTVASTPLTDDERAYLDRIQPVGDGWPYSCYWTFPTVGATFRRDALWTMIQDDRLGLVRVWWRLTRSAPWVNIRHMACASSIIWQVSSPNGGFYSTAIWVDGDKRVRTIHSNELGLRSQPVLPALRGPLTKWIWMSLSDSLQWLLWRPAIWLYVLLGGVLLISIQTHRWAYLLVAAPVICHSAGLLLTNLGQEARFHYPAHLVGLVVGVLLVCAAIARATSGSSTSVSVDERPAVLDRST